MKHGNSSAQTKSIVKTTKAVRTTRKFKGKIHVVNLIRELGINENGRFDEDRGKARAIQLVEDLSACADKCFRDGNIKNVELKDNKRDIHMLDFDARTKVAEGYTDSDEAQRLCSVSLMNKQDAIFNTINDKVKNAKVYGKRRKKAAPKAYTPKVKKVVAKAVYAKRNYLECVECDDVKSKEIIRKELDQTGVQCITMPDAIYIRLNDGTEESPKYTVYRLSNEAYLNAYAAVTKLSHKAQGRMSS